MSFLLFAFIYFLGAFTFLPLLTFALYYWFLRGTKKTQPSEDVQYRSIPSSKETGPVEAKEGWIRLANVYRPKMPDSGNSTGFMSGLQSYMQNKSNSTNPHQKTNGNGNNGHNYTKKPADLFYAVLKHGTLFLYESEQKQNCQEVIPMHDYVISMYPERNNDAGIFGKSSSVLLTPKHYSNIKTVEQTQNGTNNDSKENEGDNGREIKQMEAAVPAPELPKEQEPEITLKLEQPLYLFCARAVEKEDWYLALNEACRLMSNSEDYVEMMDSTLFDQWAMDALLRTVQHNEEQREMQWLNALLGRVFLGMYKTDTVRKIVENRLAKKVKKMKRPAFLEEIHVQHVDIGHAVPCITKPKLQSLSPEGHLVIEADMEYSGHLSVVIETNLNWSYSMRRKPIRVGLVLSIKLKSISGKLVFMIKAPPSNRYWIAFQEMPRMELEITPVVSDKQIKLSMVTNAIEAKIREFMVENIVLPNMDDIPFCNTGGKGGIFGQRVPKKTGSSVSKEEPIANVGTEGFQTDSFKPSIHRAESEGIALNHQTKTVVDTNKAKSSPDLQPTTTTASATPVTVADDQASIRSVESSQSAETTSSHTSSSALRWSAQLLHKRKKAHTITESMTEAERGGEDDDSIECGSSPSVRSMGTKNFFAKIQRRKSDVHDETRGNRSSGSKTSFYQGLLNKSKEQDPEKEKERERKADLFADRLADMRRRYNESQLQHFRSDETASSTLAAETKRPPLPPRRVPTSSTSNEIIITEKDPSQAIGLPSPTKSEEREPLMHKPDEKEHVELDQPLQEASKEEQKEGDEEEEEEKKEESLKIQLTQEHEVEQQEEEEQEEGEEEKRSRPGSLNGHVQVVDTPSDDKPPLPPRDSVIHPIPPPIPPRSS
ncbi:hypothetical protein EC973_008401 [Apophysomyces ossiformis]|uniref:SMP-LTD domain-containing protein n=1 Tax=Apophysomyces ossiformis TaxID=679940 RepID=A0A8H7EPV0_9FUNG|nr:hypothetical protein EC973_008401 [Apophysomyces ossiformis]